MNLLDGSRGGSNSVGNTQGTSGSSGSAGARAETGESATKKIDSFRRKSKTDF